MNIILITCNKKQRLTLVSFAFYWYTDNILYFQVLKERIRNLFLVRFFSLLPPEKSVCLTLQFLSSAVVSSNSSPRWKLISVFLKVLWVLITTLSPSWLMITVGLVTLPTCLVAKPTPNIAKVNNIVSCDIQNSLQSRNLAFLDYVYDPKYKFYQSVLNIKILRNITTLL